MADVGETVAGYKLVEKLGEGGFGKAFLVETGTKKKKVMKIPLEDRIEDLRREAAAHKRLKHPNIVEVEHIDAEHDPPYILMEYFEGKPLSDPDLQLYHGQAIWILKECLRALEYAHEQGVIHRDIKPSNIMYLTGAEEHPTRLLDFGLAKIRKKEDALELSMSGYKSVDSSSGTEVYMSPEQRRGEELTPASDLHSLGQVIFECFVGRRVEPGENVAKTLSKSDGMTDKYIHVLQKMLEPDLEDRYKSAKEALDDLGKTHLFEEEPKEPFEVDVSELLRYYSSILEDEDKVDVLRIVNYVKDRLKVYEINSHEWTKMMDIVYDISDEPSINEVSEATDVLDKILQDYVSVNGKNITVNDFKFIADKYSEMYDEYTDFDEAMRGIREVFRTYDYKVPVQKYPQKVKLVPGKPQEKLEQKVAAQKSTGNKVADCIVQLPKTILYSIPAYLVGLQGCIIPEELTAPGFENAQRVLASLASGAGLYAGHSKKWFGPTLALGASLIPDAFIFSNDFDKGLGWVGAKALVFGVSYFVGRFILP